MKKYYLLFANEKVLHYLAEKNISKTSMLLSIILPSVATWCENIRNPEYSNIIKLDNHTIRFYTELLNINERSFKKCIKELQDVSILKRKKADEFYCNPFWSSTGEDKSIIAFRNYCVQKQLFVPFELQDIPEEKKQEWLSEFLARNPSAEKHIGIYIGNNAQNYTAFVGKGKERLNSTDILLLLSLAFRCSYIIQPKGKNIQGNVFISNGEIEKNLAKNLCVETRTLRDSFLKLRRKEMICKLPKINGKYLVNPFIFAKGDGNNVRKFQYMIRLSGTDYFDGYAEGDISTSFSENLLTKN